MRVKSKNLIKIAFTLCCVLLISSSCTEDKYYENEYIPTPGDLPGTDWQKVEITVKQSQWQWNSSTKKYTATYDLPELDKEIYDDGAVLGYIYLGDKGVNQNMFALPFTGTGPSFYEKISYDVSYDLGRSVRFSYEWSDGLVRTPPVCNFKIVLIY